MVVWGDAGSSTLCAPPMHAWGMQSVLLLASFPRPNRILPPLQDAWDMRWADDNPELFAMMEKTRMYIFRGLDPEEPVTSSAYLCTFHDLEIAAVFIDDIMQQPDQPDTEFMTMYETRSLR